MSATEKIKVGYSAFVRLYRYNGPESLPDWLELRKDGVYIREPIDSDFFMDKEELSAGHPTDNLEEPAIRFPCALKELIDRMDELGCKDYMDPQDLEAWLLTKTEAPAEPTSFS